MRVILETCQPRKSILQGTFNPEVFTAALSPVIQFYRNGETSIDSIYTNAETFFTEATYPTEGLRQTVSSVFRRIAGDQTAPSIYRLETSFGGGKTHSLIACVHIANRGKELATVTSEIIDPQYLPAPHSVIVVGIAGDEIPVNKIKGDRLIPYTLWGELAYQIGGETLYKEVKGEAESFAAPGKHFLETVLGNKKVLIMLDELAQYAARLEVAVPNKGADQLAAFLMALNGYAKSHPGIAVIVTLAGATDAFSRQTASLTKLLNQIGNGDLHQDDAVALAEKARHGITSVVMRDATAVTPVQATEISSVLAKRLFEKIDATAAEETMQEYTEMYQRNSSLLPEEATSVRFRSRMIASYPFHPTLIDFLNNKLAQAENFQGTRGVLRVLAMTIRSLWAKKAPIQLIQVSDIDMQSSVIVDELLGRTGSADLRQVLNADIGSTDTHNLQGGLSNAQRADQRNPHPDGFPLYEKTWKVVFLNSLVGRAEGYASKVFGISQQDAIFEVATPIITPTQVRTALEEISESAFYLRYEDGKYFAHLDPTINSVLAMIRQTLTEKQITQKLRTVADGLLQENSHFRVEKNVHHPDDIVDGMDRLTLAMVALDAQKVDPMQLITQKGEMRPRERQNMILLLIPKTVTVENNMDTQTVMEGMSEGTSTTAEAWERLENLARQVLAIKELEEKPQAYGISPAKLSDGDFVTRKSERNLALTQAVSEMYTALYYPDTMGNLQRKELRPAAGEGGALISQVLQQLRDDNDMITPEGHMAGSDMQSLADGYFFKNGDKISTADLLRSFWCYRSWPMLPSRGALEALLRDGVQSGVWVAYKMSNDPTDTLPGELYSQKKPLPGSVGLLDGGYSIMTVTGAKKRGWLDSDQVPNEKVKIVIHDTMQTSGAVTIQDLTQAVQAQLANATEQQIKENVQDMLQTGGYGLYQGKTNQQMKPAAMVDGFTAFSHEPQPDEVLITRAEQSERGWLDTRSRGIRLSGNEGAKKLFPLLRRLGSLYTRSGATSTIDQLDISDLKLPSGGTLRFALDNATPADIKRLDELLQILCDTVKVTDATEADLLIGDPDANCAFVKELKK